MTIKKIDSNSYSKYREEVRDMLHISYKLNFQSDTAYIDRLVLEKSSELQQYIYKDAAIVFGAFDNSELLGFIWAFEHNYFDEKRMHINQIIIKEDFRGQGIAKKLITHIEHYAKKRGINIVDLNVSSVNKIAEKLYINNGYNIERKYLSKKI